MTAASAPRDVPELLTVRDYAEILRRRARLVVTVALLVGIVAAAATTISRTTYSATLELLVQQSADAEGDVVTRALLGTTDLATQQRIVTSVPVAERVARELGRPTDPAALRELTDHVTVQTVGETSVLELSAEHDDPELAARLPQVFADQYLAYRREVADERIAAAREELQQLQETVRSDLDSINQQLTGASGGEAEELRAERERLTARREVIATQLIQLDTADEALFTGQVLVPATMPQERSLAMAYARNVGLGLLFGLALGAALAFVREWVQDRIVRPGDVTRRTDAPLLGWAPTDGALLSTSGGHDDEHTLEAYRALRATVQAASRVPTPVAMAGSGSRHDVGPPLSVLVAAADTTTPSGRVAANLAVAFARSGLRVLLADAQPTGGASTLVEPTTRTGLYGLVGCGGTDTQGRLEATSGTEDLHVVPPGSANGVDRDRLTAARLGRFLETLAETVDVVVVDAGPAVAAPEAVALAPAVTDVVLAARWQATSRSDLGDAAQRIRDVEGRLMGTVLCPASSARA